MIFHAQWVWNLLLWPLVVRFNPDMRVLPQGIALFKGGYNTPYPKQLALSAIACIPLLILLHLPVEVLRAGDRDDGIEGVATLARQFLARDHTSVTILMMIMPPRIANSQGSMGPTKDCTVIAATRMAVPPMYAKWLAR